MPIVRARRTVTPDPLPRVTRTAADTPESLGADAATARSQTHATAARMFQGLAALTLGEAQKIADEERQRAERVQALGWENGFSELNRETMLGEAGILRVQGADVLEAGRAARDRWRQTADKQLPRPQDAARALAYDTIRARFEQNFDTTVSRHELEQTRAAEVNAHKAGLANALQDGVIAALDPVAQRDAYARAAGIIRTYPGLTDEERTELDRGVVSTLNAGTIRALLSAQRYDEARAAWQTLGDTIQGEDRATLQAAVIQGGVEGAGQRIADHIRGHNPAGTLTQWLDDLPADLPAAVRTRATAELRMRFDVRRAEARDAYEATHDRAQGAARLGQPLDPGDLAVLTLNDQAGVRALQALAAKRQEPENDWDVVADLYELMTDETTFAAENLRRYRPFLNDATYTKFLEKQTALREAKPGAVRAATIDTEQFNVLAAGAGFKPYDPLPGERSRLGKLRYAVETEIDRRQRDPKVQRELTRPEKAEVMQTIVDQDILVGWAQKRRPVVTVDPLLEREDARNRVPMAEIDVTTLTDFRKIVRSASARAFALTDAAIDARFADRLERAAAARLLRLPEATVEAILLGKR